MNLPKKIFTNLTGYWLHKQNRLPVGADLRVDTHLRLGYGSMDVMFDVGANVGQTREWFRSMEPDAMIYSFEPVLGTFEELKKNSASDKKAVSENLAFADTPGEKTISLFEENSCLNTLNEQLITDRPDAKKEVIKIDTIDRYCERKGIEKIDFLKVDTEGYELQVLQGAAKMLNEQRISFIYCEVGFLRSNNRNTYFADLTEWLAERDYNFFGLYGLISNGWRMEFGNALFVAKSVFSKMK